MPRSASHCRVSQGLTCPVSLLLRAALKFGRNHMACNVRSVPSRLQTSSGQSTSPQASQPKGFVRPVGTVISYLCQPTRWNYNMHLFLAIFSLNRASIDPCMQATVKCLEGSKRTRDSMVLMTIDDDNKP